MRFMRHPRCATTLIRGVEQADTSYVPPNPKTAFVCQSCGNQFPKWIGRCPNCGGWNTLVEERVVAAPKSRGSTRTRAPREPIPLDAVPPDAEERLSTGIGGFDRVLGGGVGRGSLVLLGGDPGIGKSSLLMQASASIGTRGTVLYVSGEESAAQIKLRARRFGIEGPNILVLAETDLATVIEAIRRIKPLFTVIDSIQTMSSDAIGSAAGGVSQLRECTARLLEVAKGDDVPIVLVGHVTTEGAVAGARGHRSRSARRVRESRRRPARSRTGSGPRRRGRARVGAPRQGGRPAHRVRRRARARRRAASRAAVDPAFEGGAAPRLRPRGHPSGEPWRSRRNCSRSDRRVLFARRSRAFGHSRKLGERAYTSRPIDPSIPAARARRRPHRHRPDAPPAHQ